MATPSSTTGPPGPPKRTSSKSSRNYGLQKSNSTVSMASNKSYDSISATGAHPLGSLRVHKVDDASPLKPLQEQDSDHGQDGIHVHSRSHSHGSNGIGVDLGSMEMDGDVVLLLDLPEKFTVGYDSISFTAKHFAGLKEIPPGAHFFWASETDASSMRSGFWFVSGPKEDVQVVQWDKFNDVLCEPASQTEVRFQLANLPSVYPKLPSYYSPVSQGQGAQADLQALDDLQESGLWPRLVNCVSESVLRRLTGRPTGPWHFHTTDRVKGTIVLPAERELEQTVSVVAVNELTFSFTQTDRTYTADSTGADRTEQAVDATSHITAALNAPGDTDADTNPDLALTEEDVVGELQFAFLAGMHLGNESCIHQWWHMILRLVLRAYRLPVTKPRLARRLLETLTAQLRYDDARLDGSVLEFGADYPRELRLALTVYKRRLDETLLALGGGASDEQVAVGTAFAQLEELAWRFDWDLRGDYVRAGRVMLEDGEQVEVEMDDLAAEDERGEFAPEVVEMDENGRQKGLMSWD